MSDEDSNPICLYCDQPLTQEHPGKFICWHCDAEIGKKLDEARAPKAEATMKSYVHSDCAGIHLGFGKFYYGYEVEQNGEWCFRAQWISTNGAKRDVIIPFSELGARDSSDCAECMLEGIAKLFERKLIAFTK